MSQKAHYASLYDAATQSAARIMYDQLVANDHKGHWGYSDPAALFEHAIKKFDELRSEHAAIEAYDEIEQDHLERLTTKGADVMNMVMMFLDTIGALREERIPTINGQRVDRDRERFMTLPQQDLGLDVNQVAEKAAHAVANAVLELGDSKSWGILVQREV